MNTQAQISGETPKGAMLKWGLQEELVVTMPNHGLLQAA